MSESSQSAAPVKRIEVSAGLLFRNRRLLITRRRAKDHLGGLWEFPGGKRETGERFESCLRRELHEELGTRVEVGALIETIAHDYPGKSVLLQFFRCTLAADAPEPQPLGCDDLAWISPEEIDRYEFPAADARLLARLRAETILWEA
jgi:mutator protein MutT